MPRKTSAAKAAPLPDASTGLAVTSPISAAAGAPDPASPQGPETTGAESAPASAAVEVPPAPVDPQPAPLDVENHPESTVAPSSSGVVVRVKGPAKGRWRAGRQFGPEAVDIPVEDLTDEDLMKLNGDPELTCVVISGDD